MIHPIAIVVSGGPAPGINSAIASIVIECEHHGIPVQGIQDGFQGLVRDGVASLRPLSIRDVSRLHGSGGSVLGTSRANPLATSEAKYSFVSTLAAAQVTKLVVIGGEGSLYLSQRIAKECAPLSVIHVPKTIDNDLPLPDEAPSFGYESARQAGTRVVETLMVDAKTTGRWYIVTCMGRTSGALSLGIGLSGSATITVIPEECARGEETLNSLAFRIATSIRIRAKEKKLHGVAIIAEGLIDTLAASEPLIKNAPRDHIGRIRLSDVNLGDALLPILKHITDSEGISCAFTTKDIGYELRCCPPCPYDVEYTRCLGYGAAQLLFRGESNKIVTFARGTLGAIPLESLNAPDGTIHPRVVDLTSDLYTVARHHMVLNDSITSSVP